MVVGYQHLRNPPCIVGRYELLKFISARGAWPPQTVFGRVLFKQGTQVLRSAIKQPRVDIHPWLKLPVPFETHEYASDQHNSGISAPKALRSFVHLKDCKKWQSLQTSFLKK